MSQSASCPQSERGIRLRQQGLTEVTELHIRRQFVRSTFSFSFFPLNVLFQVEMGFTDRNNHRFMTSLNIVHQLSWKVNL